MYEPNLAPVVGFHSNGESVRVNFGVTPFTYEVSVGTCATGDCLFFNDWGCVMLVSDVALPKARSIVLPIAISIVHKDLTNWCRNQKL